MIHFAVIMLQIDENVDTLQVQESLTMSLRSLQKSVQYYFAPITEVNQFNELTIKMLKSVRFNNFYTSYNCYGR